MKIMDCHVHAHGAIATDKVLQQMDINGVEKTIVLSEKDRTSLERTRANLELTASAVRQAPDRLTGLACVNPLIPGMADLAEEALTDMGFAGFKMFSDHWYAYEERLEPFWERMDKLRARIQFHTGILYACEDSSRFSRPVYLEKLLHYPRIRFVMAHISWPWCEECLAVMGRMRSFVKNDKSKWQSYIDLTPGTPPHIRKEAVRNAISFCGADRLMFGTDSSITNDSILKSQKGTIDSDLAIFAELGLSQEEQEQIMYGTACELFCS